MSDPARNDETAAAPEPLESPAVGFRVEEAELPGDEVLRLQLDQFEGPFEVLLYLIKTQEIDIFDIPIVQVTEQYLRFLDLLAEENLDVAGEFLVMAATLIQIKSRMILPVDVEEEEEEIEEEDPRLELVEKLLEYRRFRDLAHRLGDLQERRFDCFGRRVRPQAVPADDDEDMDLEVSMYDLTKAIRKILRFVVEGEAHAIIGEGVSIDEKIAHIEDALRERDSITWSELFHGARNRMEIVCCLLAILELCRMNRVRAHQHRSFGDIRIFAREPGDDAPESEEAATDALAG